MEDHRLPMAPIRHRLEGFPNQSVAVFPAIEIQQSFERWEAPKVPVRRAERRSMFEP